MAMAMKDLEIRGAGNLLGGEQSGHIAGVGFDLYVRLVGEAVADFRGEAGRPSPSRDADRAAGRRAPAARLPGPPT
jgi:transcription-repair coupling factor (superfamily II helicase)